LKKLKKIFCEYILILMKGQIVENHRLQTHEMSVILTLSRGSHFENVNVVKK